MPLDLGHDAARHLPVLRPVAEAGVVPPNLDRRTADGALEQVAGGGGPPRPSSRGPAQPSSHVASRVATENLVRAGAHLTIGLSRTGLMDFLGIVGALLVPAENQIRA